MEPVKFEYYVDFGDEFIPEWGKIVNSCYQITKEEAVKLIKGGHKDVVFVNHVIGERRFVYPHIYVFPPF